MCEVVGQDVGVLNKATGMWVLEKCEEPMSYEVETRGDNKVLRNRSHLREGTAADVVGDPVKTGSTLRGGQ